MITNIVLLGFYYILLLVLSPILLLDPVSAESGFGLAISNLVSSLANINQVFPLDTVFTIFGLILVIEVGVMIYKIIMWVIRRIPTQS